MLAFKTPELADKPWVDELLARADNRSCDYNFTNMFVWCHVYRAEIARLDDFLMIHVCGPAGCSYLYPAGSGDMATALRALEEEAEHRGRPLRLLCLTQQQVEQVDALYPGRFEVYANRDSFDYLYTVDKLADLGGKKLHAKRNHINRFLEQNPTWQYEEMNRDNIAQCLEMNREWYRRSLQKEELVEDKELGDEGIALRTALAHFEALGLEGGLIRVYGEVVAFTVGERLNSDTFVVHFEKAYGEMQGAYAIINREFARQVRQRHPDILYLNREEDMGLEGLRRAKESYYPDLMVEKHTATSRV